MLLTRGLIEPAPSKSGPKIVKHAKFRLTESGRKLGLEAAPRFRWPAAQSKIAPCSHHGDRLRSLIHLQTELTRLGHHPDWKLDPAQEELLSDLEDGLDEEALADMHDYWNYNHKALGARTKNYTGGPRPGRPRIDLIIFINQRRNLSVTWCPTGIMLGQVTPECDWAHWRAVESRGVAWGTRPSNELLFLHNVGEALHPVRDFYSDYRTPEMGMIDAILLIATAGLIGELKDRLKRTFDVRMISDVFLTWREVESKHWPSDPHSPHQVLETWTIEDIEARTEKFERAELERLPEKCGLPVDVFVKVLAEADVKRPTGPAPSPHTKDDRIARILKKAGYTKVSN
jgi:hypothetical protein